MKRLSVLSLAVLALGACGDANPAAAPSDPREMVLTPGVTAPAPTAAPAAPRRSDLAAGASLGGSSTTPLSLNGQNCTAFPAQAVVVTYSVTGRQQNPATFQVNTKWVYDGSGFAGSVPTTVSVPARAAGDAATIRTVTLSVENGTTGGSGAASFTAAPFNVSTSSPAALSVADGGVTVHVAFGTCAAANTAPWLTLPDDVTAEATSAAGAAVSFAVPASDTQDGDLTDDVVCKVGGTVVHSGDTFPLGSTTVSCSVRDGGGMSAEGGFDVHVRDTTAPVFTSFPGNATLVAQNAGGRAIDLSSFGIAAEDRGPNGEAGDVSGPVGVSCTVGAVAADGFRVAIGQTATVSCAATDASAHPSPNTSAPATFTVFVTLDLSGMTGFLSPLRMDAPFSAHKAGSTIPHKLGAPRYADGTPATDLASGLRLVLTNLGTPSETFDTETTADFSAGSTAWRWDAAEQQYVFNVRTAKTWSLNEWSTTVSYAGITLAETHFKLNK